MNICWIAVVCWVVFEVIVAVNVNLLVTVYVQRPLLAHMRPKNTYYSGSEFVWSSIAGDSIVSLKTSSMLEILDILCVIF